MTDIQFISITSRWDPTRILYRGQHATLRAALVAAVASDANLRDANLSDANLSGADLRDADLSDANLRGADLSDANLRVANLRDANLSDANLRVANLRDANLRGAQVDNVPIVPDLDIKVEAATRDPASLNMGAWHSCATTHCRAGWAVVLAGEAGKALEAKLGPAAAGALIYWKSAGHIPDFYATDAEARKDIVRLADAARTAKQA